MRVILVNTRIPLTAIVLAFAVTQVLADFNDSDESSVSNISNSRYRFSQDFLEVLAKNESGNFIFSPLGLHATLSMLYFGARDTTQDELRSALHLPNDENLVKHGYQRDIDSLRNVTKVELRLANKLFTTDEYELLREFKEITNTYFRSEAQLVNFTKTAEAASTINNWCANQTEYKITEVIKPDDLKDAQLVLVNAIYFEGAWMNMFNYASTKRKPFYTSEETYVTVDTLYTWGGFYSGSIPELRATFVKLFYEGAYSDRDETLCMYIVLPDEVNGLRNGGSNFNNINFGNLRSEYGKLDLYLPKFKIETTLDLKSTLTKMGISEIFGREANFSGINNQSNVYVSKIIQKAFIEINEMGTEAAAVTAPVISYRSGGGGFCNSNRFIVDKPFVYSIVHEKTNTVLFQGRVLNPAR